MAATHFQHLYASRHAEWIREVDDFRLRRPFMSTPAEDHSGIPALAPSPRWALIPPAPRRSAPSPPTLLGEARCHGARVTRLGEDRLASRTAFIPPTLRTE